MLVQKTVYFRKEDVELWENVSNKAQFLHDALTGIPPKNVIRTPRDAQKAVGPIKGKPTKKLCAHGNPKGSCLQKGCYAK